MANLSLSVNQSVNQSVSQSVNQMILMGVFCLLIIITVVGLNKIYSFIVIISSANKYRKHKSSMLI